MHPLTFEERSPVGQDTARMTTRSQTSATAASGRADQSAAKDFRIRSLFSDSLSDLRAEMTSVMSN